VAFRRLLPAVLEPDGAVRPAVKRVGRRALFPLNQPRGHTARDQTHLGYAIECGGPDSLVFASDVPPDDFDDPPALFDRVRGHFDAETVEGIMGGTAVEVIGFCGHRVKGPPRPAAGHSCYAEPVPMSPMANATFEVYEDRGGQWRWRLVHDNGNVIADGGEGYASRQKCEQGLESVRTNAPEAPVEEVDHPTGTQ
jgi:uncharacterized protein YegP (UPF0339 family)